MRLHRWTVGEADLEYVLRVRIFGWILRGSLAVDFALCVLTFIPAFSGIGREPGLADRLLGNYRFGGWRLMLCGCAHRQCTYSLRGFR